MYSRGTGWYLNRKPELNPEIKLNVAYPYRLITTLTIIDITSQFCNQQFHWSQDEKCAVYNMQSQRTTGRLHLITLYIYYQMTKVAE